MIPRMIGDITLGSKYIRIKHQLKFLIKCQTIKICPNEIQDLAARIRSDKNKKTDKNLEKFIMNKRIESIRKDLRETLNLWKQSTKHIDLDEDIPEEVKSTHRFIKNKELINFERKETTQKVKKIKWLTSRQKGINATRSDTYEDVIVSDDMLINIFGEGNIEPIVLGDIIISKNAQAFMILPNKTKMFKQINIIDERTNAEIHATKQRWSTNSDEDTIEEVRDNIDQQFEEDRIHNKDRIDFRRTKSTSLKHNKVIYLPDPVEGKAERKIQDQREEVVDIVREYAGRNIKTISNLTPQEELGRQEIKAGIRDKGWILYNTDKSGRLVLDTKENFLKAMEVHVRDHRIVSLEDIREAEKIINNHSRAMIRLLNIGENVDQTTRCKNALIVDFCDVPVLQGLRKDHKLPYDPVLGPPCRPLLSARTAPNAPLANTLSNFLRGIGDDLSIRVGTDAINSEEICYEFHKFNYTDRVQGLSSQHDQQDQHGKQEQDEDEVHSNKVVGSMDIVGLYPNITQEIAKQAVIHAVSESTIEIRGVNKDFLVRYIAITTPREVIDEIGIEEYIPFPRSTTTLNSLINDPKPSQFKDPVTKFIPDHLINTIIGVAIAQAVEVVMKHNYFKLGDNYYCQTDGGAIGSDLTG